jgi:Pan3 Pseudokinase domain
MHCFRLWLRGLTVWWDVKLDAGTDERIMLVSRDEQSVLVVSYKDVKACVASAFVYVYLQYLCPSLIEDLAFLGSCHRDKQRGPPPVGKYVS